jgi:hypothetical protein
VWRCLKTAIFLGYKYQDPRALEQVETTPLAQLAFVPVDETQPVREPVGQFEVTFTPAGQVEVVPWEAAATGLSSAPAPGTDDALPTLESAVTDGETIRTLNSTLYDSILTELEPLSASEPLEYRVRITEGGDIVGYEPLNATALLLVQETPLPGLVAPGAPREPQADYRVVFTETGVLEVSPWDGWPD